MELEKVLSTRRNIRKYIKKPVEQEKIADFMDQYIETHKENKTIKHSANIIRTASNLILVFNVSEIKNDSDLLSIRDYIPVKEEINSLLNIPKKKHPESIIALGYSDHTPAYLPRKTYQETVIYEEALDA